MRPSQRVRKAVILAAEFGTCLPSLKGYQYPTPGFMHHPPGYNLLVHPSETKSLTIETIGYKIPMH